MSESTLARLLRPGVRTMRRLPLTLRLALVVASLGLPLLAVTGYGVWRVAADIRFTRAEIAGLEVNKQLGVLQAALQQSRDVSYRSHYGDADAVAGRQGADALVQQAAKDLDGLMERSGSEALDQAWRPLRTQLATRGQQVAGSGGDADFDAHSSLIDSVRDLMTVNAEQSGLILDPYTETYFLMDIVTRLVPGWLDAVERLRVQGSGHIAAMENTPEWRTTMAGGMTVIGRLQRQTSLALDAIERVDGQRPVSWTIARDSCQALIDRTRQVLSEPIRSDDAQGFHGTAGDASVAVARLGRDAQEALASALARREHAQVVQAAWLVGSFLLGFAVLGYLVVSFYAASFGALRKLQRGVRAVADGDLAHAVSVQGRDEMAQIGTMIEAMNLQLSSMVSQVRSSAAHVGMAGRQAADGNLALSMRTEEQASVLQQAVGAMEEIRSTAADNASRASEIDELTQSLGRSVTDGGTSMQASVDAMRRLQQTTREVGEIVEVIDDIAFQTGMLALNAAVEASHAGDTGKGFAVVAQEVRQLAQRCTESAERIRRRVGEAESAVADSGARLDESERAFNALRSGVEQISAQVRAIAASSDRQNERIVEIAASVGSLDEITRQNAAMVEQASLASRTLVDRAQSLRETVASIRLRHGSVDEAHELVQRARTHLDQAGREQALADFQQPDGGFIDRDLYVFGFDRDGIYFCFGARPDLVGMSLDDMDGLDGAALLRDAWARADAGGGWVQYTMVNPITRRPTVKESWVEAIGPNELIGCGVFADAKDAAAHAAAASKSAATA